MRRYLSAVVPKSAKTNLTLPLDLATALDDALPWAKHQRYIGRSDVRNDLIRFLLKRGAEALHAERAAHEAPKKRR